MRVGSSRRESRADAGRVHAVVRCRLIGKISIMLGIVNDRLAFISHRRLTPGASSRPDLNHFFGKKHLQQVTHALRLIRDATLIRLRQDNGQRIY